MTEKISGQIYIIAAACYKCEKDMNVAVIKCGPTSRNGFCGPDRFTEKEIRLAENHKVVIRQQFSFTREESYMANTCLHCSAFIGQHFLFTEYFTAAMCGDYEFTTIDLNP